MKNMRNKNRLIYAGEALDRLRKLAREPYYQHEGEDWSVGVSMACGEVHECATVDAVAVVHGRWRWCGSDRWNDAYQCSNCGKIAMNDSNYCPNCGATMDA